MAINPFKGTSAAEVTERGTYLKPGGNYLLRVHKTIYKETRKSGPAFIVEFDVLESDNPEDPVDSRRTWFQGMKDKTVALPSIKDFFVKLCQVNEEDKDEFTEKFLSSLDETIYEATQKKKLFRGFQIRCETQDHITQQNKHFTRHIWTPWEGEQPEMDDEDEDEDDEDGEG